MRTLRPFLVLYWQQRRWVFVSACIALLAAASSLGLLAVSGWLITATAYAGAFALVPSAFDFGRPGAAIRLLALSRAFGRYGEQLLLHQTVLKLLSELRVWVFDQCHPNITRLMDHYRSGDLLQRLLHHIDTLDNLYIRCIVPTLVLALLTLGTVGLFMLVDLPGAGIFSLLLLLIMVGLPWLAWRWGHQPGLVRNQSNDQLSNQTLDILSQLPWLVHQRSGLWLRDYLLKPHFDQQHAQQQLTTIQAFSQGISFGGSGLLITLILMVGLPLVSDQRFDGPWLAATVLVLMGLFEYLPPVAESWRNLYQTSDAAGELQKLQSSAPLMDKTVAVIDGPATVHFDHVSFRYHPLLPPLLDNLDWQLPSNKITVLMGDSGCGKTTLAQLLLGFRQPNQGLIKLNNQDLSPYTTGQRCQWLGYLPQKPHLFNGPLLDNLLLAQPEASLERIWQLLHIAQLASFVEQLPAGLEHWVGENGTHLSRGQQRRLALVQCLLRDSRVIVLDEPCESLDHPTAEQMRVVLRESLVGKTVLWISHHQADCAYADQVAYLQDGAIHYG